MVEPEKPEKIELDEVMLAMDVVDTLRHEQQLVERELASDERDQALIEKVKRMYAAQGLEVTDEVIAAGRGSAAGKPVRVSSRHRPEGRCGWPTSMSGGTVWPNGRRCWPPHWWGFFSLPVCLCGAGSAPTAKNGQKFQYHHQPAAGSAQRGQTAAGQSEAGLGPGRKILVGFRSCCQTSSGGGRAAVGRSRDQATGLGKTADAAEPDSRQTCPGRRGYQTPAGTTGDALKWRDGASGQGRSCHKRSG